jgi:hypothetical protein
VLSLLSPGTPVEGSVLKSLVVGTGLTPQGPSSAYNQWKSSVFFESPMLK